MIVFTQEKEKTKINKMKKMILNIIKIDKNLLNY